MAQLSSPSACLLVTVPPETSAALALPFDLYPAPPDALRDAELDLLIWNAAAQHYEAGSSWSALTAGDGFWLVNTSAIPQSLLIAGRLPAEPRSKTVIPRLNSLGSPHAAAIATNTLASTGDRWLDPAAPDTPPARLAIGRGYWYERQGDAAAELIFEEPFTGWTGDAWPEITAITTRGTGTVEITLSAPSGTALSLYRQDVPADGALDPLAWELATRGWADPDGLWVVHEPQPDFTVDQGIRAYLVASSERTLSHYLHDKNISAPAPDRLVDETSLVIDGGSPESLTGDPESWLRPESALDPALAHTNSGPTLVRSGLRVIYVSQKQGRDDFTGAKALRIGADGPKQSIAAGLAAADEADRVQVLTGSYREQVRLGPDHGLVRIDGFVRLRTPTLAPPPPATLTATNRLDRPTLIGEQP
jgi:hypothetical protein